MRAARRAPVPLWNASWSGASGRLSFTPIPTSSPARNTTTGSTNASATPKNGASRLWTISMTTTPGGSAPQAWRRSRNAENAAWNASSSVCYGRHNMLPRTDSRYSPPPWPVPAGKTSSRWTKPADGPVNKFPALPGGPKTGVRAGSRNAGIKLLKKKTSTTSYSAVASSPGISRCQRQS